MSTNCDSFTSCSLKRQEGEGGGERDGMRRTDLHTDPDNRMSVKVGKPVCACLCERVVGPGMTVEIRLDVPVPDEIPEQDRGQKMCWQ